MRLRKATSLITGRTARPREAQRPRVEGTEERVERLPLSIGEPRHRAIELVFVRIAHAAVALLLGDRAAVSAAGRARIAAGRADLAARAARPCVGDAAGRAEGPEAEKTGGNLARVHS